MEEPPITSPRGAGDGFALRRIRAADDPAMGRIIRSVMTEFGADGAGFSIHDGEVDSMSSAYGGPRAFFEVVVRGEEVLGGAGVAPLDGGPVHVCELKKMYFLREARGLGLGARLLRRCLDAARQRGFTQCYVETHHGMVGAQRLYERSGFKPLDHPMGETGHHGCDRWYLLEL